MTATKQTTSDAEAPRAKEAGRYDAFISYSRSDYPFVSGLCEELRGAGKEVWLDLDITGGAQWRERVRLGIEACKSLVFVVSPKSVGSEACRSELEDAVTLSKLVIPVIFRDPDSPLPDVLRESEWIFLRDEDDRNAGVRRLLEALEADLDWRDQHTRLAGRAREWLDHDRNSSYLLRGVDLREAEQWLAGQSGHREAPTREQTEYIAVSRTAAGRRLYTLVGALSVGLAIAIALAIFAFVQRADAIHQSHVAESGQLAAQATNTSYTELASVLALGAYRLSPTLEARSAILTVAGSHQLGGELVGPTLGVTRVAYAPNGKVLAAGSADGTIWLWDTASHLEIGHPLVGRRNDRIDGLAFDPIKPILASVGIDGDLRLWDADTETEIGGPLSHTPPGAFLPTSQDFDVAFSPNGKTIAVASTNEIQLWSVSTPRRLRVLPVPNYPVSSVAFSHDGRTLVSGSEDSMIRFWRVRTGRQIGSAAPSRCGVVNQLAFSPDDQTVAAACDDGTVRLWDARHRRPIGVLAGHTATVWSVAFSPDGKTLVSGSADRTIRLWSLASRRQIGSLLGNESDVYSVAFSPTGTTLASGSDDQTVRFWSLYSTRQLGPPIGRPEGPVNAVAISPDGRFLAAAYQDGRARLWSMRTRRQIQPLDLRKIGPIDSVAFSPDSKTLALASAWGVLILFDIPKRQIGATEFDEFASRQNPAPAKLTFSRDGTLLGIVDNNPGDNHQGDVFILDLKTGKTLENHYPGFGALAFSADDKIVAMGGPAARSNTIKFLDLRTRKTIGPVLKGNDEAVNALAYSPDGKILASGDADDTLRLWDPSAHTAISGPLTGHTAAINALAFSPDGKLVATGSADDTIRLWDVAARQPLGAPLTGDTGPVTGVAFSPDGRTLASSSRDGTVRLWSVDPIRTYIDQLCGYIPPGSAQSIWHEADLSITYQPPPCRRRS